MISRTRNSAYLWVPIRSSFFGESLPEGTYLDITLPPATQKLASNSSEHFGGWYFDVELFLESVDPAKHINMKELLALHRALISLGPRLHPGPLVWEVGNTAAQFAIINQGSNSSEELCNLAVDTVASKVHISIELVQLSSEI